MLRDVTNLIPDIKVNHGGLEPPKKPKARVHPIVKLQNYIAKNNLKLMEFFKKFDADGSMSVSHAEFKQGLQVKQERSVRNSRDFNRATILQLHFFCFRN